MIYCVTEWIDNSFERFYFDSSKIDKNNRFEASYLLVIQTATMCGGVFDVSANNMMSALIYERYSKYQNSMPCWERLKANTPCHVDADVELILVC